ncbi:MAG TPA: glycerophosphodiester phosphodiesterase [Candidatus Dormibacteraeota bacterium]|nr:glycerophosphodiester phosphodiesterase [Candidatus Dormibacteraeota bacterium]
MSPRRAFLDWPQPIPFAHRGGAGEHPENTMPAFEAAVRLGYRYLETDAHLTRDGVVMAFHDSVLDRVTDRSGPIETLSAAEVERADAGYTFSADGGRSFPHRGRGVRIPRLDALLDAWPEVRVNIDPKSDAVVAPLVEVLRRHGAFDRVCIGSFSDARLARVRALSGDSVCTSMGPRATALAWAACRTGRIPRQGADCLQIPVRARAVTLVTPALLRAAKRSGLPVHVWTIDDRAEMERLLDLGVDGLMSDAIPVLREVLQARGQWVGTGPAATA